MTCPTVVVPFGGMSHDGRVCRGPVKRVVIQSVQRYPHGYDTII